MRTLAAVLKALSDETRLAMLGLVLREGELCVCDFVAVLGVTQSKASRHLRYLVNAGLLQDRREAVWVHYRLVETPGPVHAAVLAALREIVPGALPAGLTRAVAQRRRARGGGDCPPPAATARRRRR